jgi:hypothetical protein
VALKFVAAEPDQLEQLMREARAQARVEHPHVCKVFEVSPEGDRPFICMQLIDGETLERAAPGLGPRALASLLADVADGVEAAHRLGIVHRDIKPGNIMVERSPGGEPHAYVMDFGLARDVATTLSHGVVGTPAFMAPEQARGDAHEIGPRTDVSGLGATLFAALTGEPPFDGTSVMQVLAAVVEREPPRLRARLPGAPPALELIVATCLAKDPARRYASAGALSADLRRYLAEAPIEARPPSLRDRLARRVRRRLPLVLAGAVLAAAATAAVVFVLGRRARWEPRALQLGPTFYEWAGAVTIAPDGGEIAYASQRDGSWRIYAETLSPDGATGPSRALTPPALGAFGAHFSRDGREIFFSGERPGGFDVYRMPRGGGPASLIARDFSEIDDCGGGRLILRSSVTPGCAHCERLVLREPDGRERELLRTSHDRLHGAGCDATGRLVTYARRQPLDERRLEVLDLETGAIRVLTPTSRGLAGPAFHPDGASVLYGHRGGIHEVTLDGRIAPITGGSFDSWPSPSADGRLLLYQEDFQDTPVFAARTGEPPRRVGRQRGARTVVALTRDGAALLLSGEDEVAILTVRDGVQRTLTAGRRPSLAPDGREIFFLRGSGEATEVWSIPTGGEAPRLRGRVAYALQVHAGRDAVHVAVAREGYHAWRLPLDGGPPAREAAATVAAVVPSPDGGWVLVERRANGADSDLVVPAGAPLDDPRAVRVTWRQPHWGANGALHGYEDGTVKALVPATGVVRAVMAIDLAPTDSWVVSLDEETVYRTVPEPQMRRMMITNFGDRPRP